MVANLIEVQSYNDGRSSIVVIGGYPTETKEQEDTLISAVFAKCSIAAKSSVDIHTVEVVAYDGSIWKDMKFTFYHGHVEEESD